MRKLFLGLILILLTWTAVLLLTGRNAQRGPVVTHDAAPSSDATATGELVELAGPGASASAASGRSVGPLARAEAWVLVLGGGTTEENETAACTATLLVDSSGVKQVQDAPTLTSVGGSRWDAPLAGTWELSVEVAGIERVRRQVVVPPQRTTRTTIQLDARITLEGLVRDVFGAPCPSYFVGFVPRGGRAPKSPRDWLDIPHARCNARGEFTIQLPQGGTYRPFAGYGGRVLIEDTVATKLLDTTARFVTLTTPVPTRLTIRARETRGDLLATAYAVSVYRRKEIMDIVRPLPPPPEEQPLPDPNDPSLDGDQRDELLKELEAMKQEVDLEALERRRSVVPKGWRVDRSGVLGVAGTLYLTDLPAGEELRFAATRGGKPFLVPESALIDALLPTEVILTFPPPLPEGTPEPAKPRSVTVTTRLGEGKPVVSEPRVQWR